MTSSFRLPIVPKALPVKLDYNSNVLALGSCFATHIGSRLESLKFTTRVNPFGTLFHPLSIVKLLRWALEEEEPTEAHYLEWKDLCFHYDLHSDHYAPNHDALKRQLKALLQECRTYLKKTDLLLLTFGTAFIYRLKSSMDTVANCHKQAAALFEKELSDVQLMQKEFEACYKLLKAHQSSLKIILSISPVRHIKDGIEENTLSKASLHLLRHQLCNRFEDVHYFPAYEMMMDDLRDYRFYNSDMLHPNTTAIDYIWGHFSEILMDDDTKATVKKVEGILQAVHHRPLHPKSKDHRVFLEKTLAKIDALNGKLKLQDVYAEIQHRLEVFEN